MKKAIKVLLKSGEQQRGIEHLSPRCGGQPPYWYHAKLADGVSPNTDVIDWDGDILISDIEMISLDAGTDADD